MFIEGKLTKGHLFCARLCYSALPFVIAYPAERYECFLDGHRQSFEYFQGVTPAGRSMPTCERRSKKAGVGT